MAGFPIAVPLRFHCCYYSVVVSFVVPIEEYGRFHLFQPWMKRSWFLLPSRLVPAQEPETADPQGLQ